MSSEGLVTKLQNGTSKGYRGTTFLALVHQSMIHRERSEVWEASGIIGSKTTALATSSQITDN